MRTVTVDHGDPDTLAVADYPFWPWLVGKLGDWLLSTPPFSWNRLGHRLVVWSDSKGEDVLHVEVSCGHEIAHILWPKSVPDHDDDCECWNKRYRGAAWTLRLCREHADLWKKLDEKAPGL